MSRTLIASDDYNRADGPVGANYTQLFSFWGSMVVDANKVRGGADDLTQMSAARWDGAGTFTDDQYSSLVLSSGLDFGLTIGVIARASSDTGADRDFYFFRIVVPPSGSPTTELGKIVNGTVTVLVTSTSPAWAVSDRIEIECEGTTIRGLNTGILVTSFSATDSDLSTGKPGICGANAANDPKGDDWEGGNYTAGGGGGGAPGNSWQQQGAMGVMVSM